jgi:hypothetical protein
VLGVIQCVFVIQCVVCHSECRLSFSVFLSFSVLFVILSVVCHSVCWLSFFVLLVIRCVLCHSLFLSF